MKPVPILQYLDHFGRVVAPDAQAQAPAPFKPRLLRPAAADEPPRPQPAIARALRQEPAPAPRPARVQLSEAQIEARVADAYERGRRDGAEAAQAEAAETLEREIAGERERATLAQLDFQLCEYAHLAEAISAGLQEIEQRVADVVARLLAPLLTHATTDRIVEALCDDLARLRVGGAPGLIKIRGPERVLAALRERVAYLSVDVEFVADHGVEATIEADETKIVSQLQPWADLIASLLK